MIDRIQSLMMDTQIKPDDRYKELTIFPSEIGSTL